jgi:hypothetical protein
MRGRREVIEGQRYRRLGVRGTVWEVVAVRKDGYGAQHAQLRRTDDALTLKTLAVSVLLDSAQFEPVASE